MFHQRVPVEVCARALQSLDGRHAALVPTVVGMGGSNSSGVSRFGHVRVHAEGAVGRHPRLATQQRYPSASHSHLRTAHTLVVCFFAWCARGDLCAHFR